MRREPQPDPGPGEEHVRRPGTRPRTSGCWRSTDPPWTQTAEHSSTMGGALTTPRSALTLTHCPLRQILTHLSASLSTSSSSTSNCRFV